MKSRILLFLGLLSCIGLQMFAQVSVSGKVVDAGGIEMPGVNIAIKGTMVGTMTGADGTFTLSSIPGGKDAVLVFSFIGFRSQEVKVGNQTFINVKLEEDTEQLEEVVVIGYGTARKKDLSGAISNVQMTDELAALPNPNVMGSLSSKVAGFRYSPTNSAGGDNFSSLNIRGKNAIPAGVSAGQQSVNQPLLIVDGVISFGSINEINTNDIQSVDVLKDASAAAIYGSRAANGVIIITTKRGLSERPVINVNSSWNFSGWSRMPKMVTDEEKFFRNRFYAKQAGGSIPSDAVWSSDFDRAQLMNTVEYDAYNEGVYTDWLDEISRTGFGQKYDVSVSGRSKIVNYYISGDYTRQKGIRKGDDYEKYNIMTKLDIQAKEWLKIGLKGNYLGAKEWGVPARIQNATWMTPYSYTHARQPGYENWPNSRPDGNSASPFWGSGAGDSHLWTDDQKRNYNINGVAYAQVDFPFLQGLSYRISLNARRNSAMRDVFNDPRIWVNTDNTADMDNPDKFGVNVEGYSYTQLSSTWNVDNIFTYTRDFKNHHVDAMIGYTREASNSELLRTDFKGFSVPTTLGVYKQDLANTRTIRRERTSSSAIGILTRVNYNYKSTYYANFTFRRDGYSAFSAGNKWGNFYGASAAWVLSNENFVKDNADWLDYLKLRFSWGQNGSRSVSPYATIGSVRTTYTWFGDSASGSAFGLVPSSLPNRSLTWATVEKFNVGIDYNVLAGRLGGAVDVYAGKTTDMLMDRSVPYPTGFQTAKANAGKVTNKGIEITLNSVNIDGDGKEKFRWETNVVFDLNRNEIKSLYGKNYKGEEADDVANAVAYGFDSYYALIIGKPIGAAYDLKKVGVFQSQEEVDNYVDKDGNKIMPNAVPGDLKFEDFNEDGKIDANDRQYLGSMDPLFTINLGNTLSYKNFSLYFNFRWMQGNDTHFLGYNPHAYSIGGSGAQLDAVDPWTPTNHTNDYPRYGYNNSLNYQYWSPRSFLKLKDLVFSYNFDQKLIKPYGIEGLRLYVSGTDLFTITGWTGLDPEDGGTIAGGPTSSSMGSKGTYRTFTAGINLTF
ncbi:SusC/RagA family TonB-linked outer membrane protein [Parabacteroides merdae]|uniref:SusC/RagA family TonB-linked outer membrane protein n=1 Tax=Parabacteroides merdae TaxID=46503 RepID=UPI00232E4B48|nr:TonB-dependent receptor [Parabacteroides merdae]MDB8911416.1 TonB-dependent receptor [Parabacteroides merdae]